MIRASGLLALSAVTLTPFAAEAATVTFSAEVFTDASAVSTAGTLLEARNIEGGDVTINGVLFAAHSNAVDGNAILANTGVANTSFINGGSSLAPDLFTNGERSSGSTTPANRGVITLAGLTPGTDYVLQLFSMEDRTITELDARVLAIADADPGTPGSSRANFDLDGIDYSNDQGAIITASFTADATTQSFFLAAFDIGSEDENGVFVQGYQLREVPEPGSLAFLSMGGIAMVQRRRRC